MLLKNDGILPLDADKLSAVAVIGPNADSRAVLQGNYNGTASRYVTIQEGIGISARARRASITPRVAALARQVRAGAARRPPGRGGFRC